MQNVLQQFLIISQILAGIFSAANSSSKFSWYLAKPSFFTADFWWRVQFWRIWWIFGGLGVYRFASLASLTCL